MGRIDTFLQRRTSVHRLNDAVSNGSLNGVILLEALKNTRAYYAGLLIARENTP